MRVIGFFFVGVLAVSYTHLDVYKRQIFLRLGLSDTFLGVVIVHVLLSLPYTVKLMTDSTAAIGVTYEEAALTMVAGPLRAFWEVSIPALLPGLTASLCMGYILSLIHI